MSATLADAPVAALSESLRERFAREVAKYPPEGKQSAVMACLTIVQAEQGWISPAIEKAVAECMDLTPRGIREHLGLNKAIYSRTAAYGHFGRDPEADGGFSWERTDLIEALKKAV